MNLNNMNIGNASQATIEATQKRSASNYNPYPIVVSRHNGAYGAYLYTTEGHRVLDLLAGYSAVFFHRWSVPIQALLAELQNGCDLVSRAVYTERFAEFCEKITALTGYDRVLPASDGRSSTEPVIDALFMHAKRRGIENPNIILMDKYFHGRARTFTTNALFDSSQHEGKGPRVAGIAVVSSFAQLKRAVNPNTIGIFMEVHRGEGGPLFDNGAYVGAWELARENKIFIATDEVQTGLYRCGYLMAWQEFGEKYRPDAVVLGKALGGGIMPISALLGTEEFMSIFTPGSHGSTFGGFPPACAVACSVIDYVREHPELGTRAKEIGARFAKNLSGIPYVSVEHRGALIGIAIEGIPTAEPLCLEMFLGKYDPLVFIKHGHVYGQTAHIRIAPPILAIGDSMIDEACENTIAPVLRRAREIVGSGC